MPTDGSVNPGSQNKYESEGTIKLKRRTIKYSKGPRYKKSIKAHDAPCWNAGTPIRLKVGAKPKDNGIYSHKAIEATRVKIPIGNGVEVEILATMVKDPNNPENEKAEEYHPLIQFFNTVMMGIIQDGMTRDLDNLKSPTSTARVWAYLKRKFLTIEDPAGFADFLGKKRKEQIEEVGKYLAREERCLVDPKEHYSKMLYIND